MAPDPLDQQLVEAVLTRPRRGKADLEEAKLAGIRTRDVDDEEAEDEEEPEAASALSPDVLDGDEDATVEVVEDGDTREARLPADSPAKLDAEEPEEP